jgi:hypothetical protein
MRPAWITGQQALRERLAVPAQVPAPTPEAEMPAYMESFLGHLRLLVGVPFEYLVPDSRLLPVESIRFFYIDRSWTDRLVDGAVSVGKIGSREQAHHQAHSPMVQQQLDYTERGVRDLQRSRVTFTDLRSNPRKGAADTVTGFLIRSGVVSGWPHMDIRAYQKILDQDYDPNSQEAKDNQLVTLRLERLSPGVLIALFQGIPKMVICEEPHHGIQFGVHEDNGQFSIFRRSGVAHALGGTDVPVPVRKANRRVLGIAALRQALMNPQPAQPALPPQTGAASFAIELLNLPWRQRFENDPAEPNVVVSGGFTGAVLVASHVTLEDIHTTVEGYMKP